MGLSRRKVVSHGGGLDGMISQTAMMPEENLGLVVLTNSETPVNTIMQNKIFDVFVNAPKRDWSAERLERALNRKSRRNGSDNETRSIARGEYETEFGAERLRRNLFGRALRRCVVAEENGKLVLRLRLRRISSPIWSTGITTLFANQMASVGRV
jgi:hypothetical protein